MTEFYLAAAQETCRAFHPLSIKDTSWFRTAVNAGRKHERAELVAALRDLADELEGDMSAPTTVDSPLDAALLREVADKFERGEI